MMVVEEAIGLIVNSHEIQTTFFCPSYWTDEPSFCPETQSSVHLGHWIVGFCERRGIEEVLVHSDIGLEKQGSLQLELTLDDDL